MASLGMVWCEQVWRTLNCWKENVILSISDFVTDEDFVKQVQWNESSKATSGGASHSLKIDFFEIPAMVGNFFSFRGLPTTKFFFLASKVGDENPLKWP